MSDGNGTDRDPRRSPDEWTLPTESAATQEAHHGHAGPDGERAGHGRHGLMMIVCCIPMLAIAGLLVLTGVAGSGIILTALLCTAMMAAMMFAMPGGHGAHGPR